MKLRMLERIRDYSKGLDMRMPSAERLAHPSKSESIKLETLGSVPV